jgi:hypothetical protein
MKQITAPVFFPLFQTKALMENDKALFPAVNLK